MIVSKRILGTKIYTVLILCTLFPAPVARADALIWQRFTALPARVKSQCQILLQKNKLEVTNSPAKKNFLDLATEVRAARTTLPFSLWEDRAVLKSPYVNGHLVKLKDQLIRSLGEAEVAGQAREAILLSAKTLIHFTEGLLSTGQPARLTYHRFLKTTLLYAIQFDLLERRANAPRGSGANIRLAPDADLRANLILSSAADVERFLSVNKYRLVTNPANPEHITEIDFRQLDVNHKVTAIVPSMATLSFETLLWAQSRDLGVIKESPRAMLIDDMSLSPTQLYAYELGQLPQFAQHEQDPAMWDRLAAQVKGSTAADPRALKLKFALLYLMFHEKPTEMSCAGVREWMTDRTHMTDFKKFNANRLHHDCMDLGCAFSGSTTPEISEISAAVDGLIKDLAAICPSAS